MQRASKVVGAVDILKRGDKLDGKTRCSSPARDSENKVEDFLEKKIGSTLEEKARSIVLSGKKGRGPGVNRLAAIGRIGEDKETA